ncbi:MAG TPA: cytochrome c biogenesis protein CcdA [Bacteroidales bacterium]|nr:cytochrome c biogenesis protein CcdA [Bacteroidales bacterium]HNS45718.1 cytochrome c biogenesis protein CcdA [Bacteroidales bacterium]
MRLLSKDIRMGRLLLFMFFLVGFLKLQAQIYEPVSWSFSSRLISPAEAELLFKAEIENKWHLYSQDIPMSPPATTFTFEDVKGYELVGKVTEPAALEEYDPNFEMVLKYFADEVTFSQKIRLLTKDPVTVKGYVNFMSCDDEKCLPPADEEFEFTFNKEAKTVGSTVDSTPSGEKVSGVPVAPVTTLDLSGDTLASLTETDSTDQPLAQSTLEDSAAGTKEKRSLFYFFLISVLAGFAAILTPCVFPMIPMTVTFFMHDNESKRKARFQAIVYGFSIIAIYTVIGTVVAITLGPNFANFLSTHWLPNVLFFLVFLVFAASFLGAFELTLPSRLVTRSDQRADKGGISGAFFMALTLVLVSFSCTGPLVGAILVESAGGQILKPIVGMFGFALAFALPFTLFAFFPSWLANLPKSGGWLNAVKVVLGFIELALGLKFLSIADQTYHWGILDREVYLAFWIVIFTLMGFYLLGKLKFAHDSDLPYISVTRIILAIITFTFVVYMTPGMFGAPLKALSGYIPPQSTHDFDLNNIIRENVKLVVGSGTNASGGIRQPAEICDKPKYSDFLHLPHGLEGYFDYEQGMACARKLNKPVFIDFTGHGCVNCREMEANVWSNPKVLQRLREQFIIIALYVDDKTPLAENEWITSTYDGKIKKTVGKKFADFQITQFNVNAQPFYVLLDHHGEKLVPPRAYDLDVDEFIDFLDKGIEEFKNRSQH